MDVKRLKRIEELFHAAADLEPGERAAFLDRECAGDQDLRSEIESLITSDGDESGIVSTSAESLIREALSESAHGRQAASEPEIIGLQINQYRIQRLIGEGGMGKVYLARDEKLERNVAIKFLSERFAGDRNRRERFFREAKAASALNHPNILTVHEIGEHDRTFYIVSEYVSGETVKERIRDRNLNIPSAVDIGVQIASALAAAHGAGIVHRDIKPENVMIREDKLVKVLDFGIAKLETTSTTDGSSEAETRIDAATVPGMIIGTPQYMSPEQARGQKVDYRSDVFSLGVVLYEMVSGAPPFKGSTNIDTIGAILKDDPAPLSTIDSEVPPELERIIEKSLRKDRDQRYQTVRDMMIDLSDLRRSLELGTSSRHGTLDASPRVTRDEPPPRRSGFLLPAIGAAAMLAVILGGIYWYLSRPVSFTAVSQLRTVEVANWSSSPGEIYSVGTLSPDGKTLAFSSSRGGSLNVWVKQVASGEAVQITKDDGTSKSPVWSPSGEEIAYFSTKGGPAGIWRIPRLGGSPQLVTEIADRGALVRLWGKSEKIYFEASGDLFAVSPPGNKTEKLTDFAARGIKPRSIHVSPDESQVVYLTADEQKSSLWLTGIDGSSPKKLFESPSQMKNIAWHADSKRIFFSSAVDGTFQIFVTDTWGAVPTQLTNSENDCLVLDASADGTRILFGTAKEESDVWVVNLADKKEASIASAIDSELWPDVSPDGKTVIYQSIKYLSQGNKIFNGRLLSRGTGAQEPETLIADNAGVGTYSPDGSMIAYFELSGSDLRIKTVKANGGEPKPVSSDAVAMISFTVLPYNRIQSADYSWSPDSKRIAYVSSEGGQTIAVGNADGSGRTALTVADANLSVSCPLWSPDGKRIAYVSKTNNLEGRPILSLMAVDVESRVVDTIWTGNSFIRLIGWSADGTGLLIGSVTRGAFASTATAVTLTWITAASRQAKEIGVLEDIYFNNIFLSRDRKSIAFARHRDGRDNLWVMPAAGGEARQVTNNSDSRLYFSSLAWSPDGARIYYGKQSRFSLISMLTNFK